MSEADRIARAKLEDDQRRAAKDNDRAAAQAQADAAAELQTIGLLSQEVLVLLEVRRYRNPDPEPLTLEVERFPILGNLFGYRKIVKGGWKIANWHWDSEGPPHVIWLLADGRYCWNGRIVPISEFSDWHESRPVKQGRAEMIKGLKELKNSISPTA